MTWLERLKALRQEDVGYYPTDKTDKTGGNVSFGSAPVARIRSNEGGSVSFGSALVAHVLPSESGPTLAGDPELSQESEQPDDPEREAFEERAAIMEYDGGLSRQEAERRASAELCDKYARAREAREPGATDAGQSNEGFPASTRARERGRTRPMT